MTEKKRQGIKNWFQGGRLGVRKRGVIKIKRAKGKRCRRLEIKLLRLVTRRRKTGGGSGRIREELTPAFTKGE